MKSDPERYGTQVLLARTTGLDQKSWSNYLSGESRPSRLARRQIQKKLGIPAGEWDQQATQDPRNDPSEEQVSQEYSRDSDPGDHGTDEVRAA